MTNLLHVMTERITTARRAVALAHRIPDGDALGSLAGLQAAWRPTLTAYLAPDAPPIIARLSAAVVPTLPEDAQTVLGDADLVVIVDCPTTDHIGLSDDVLRAIESKSIVIDHHQIGDSWGGLVWRDPAAPSTSSMIAHWLAGAGRLSPEAATWLLYGLVTDTVSFSVGGAAAFRTALDLVDAGADHRQAAAWATCAETLDELQRGAAIVAHAVQRIDPQTALIVADAATPTAAAYAALRTVQRAADITMTIVLSESQRTGRALVRGSVRARPPRQALPFARRFGGGGHLYAAGFQIECALDDAVRQVREVALRLGDGASAQEEETAPLPSASRTTV